MNYTILRFLFIISCTLASTFLNGQNPGHKFGKVSPTELKAKICPIDADAKAYYIFDKGVYEIKLDNAVIHKNNTALNGGYFNFNQRHYRKKIIEASSDDDEKIEIFLAHSNGHKESISSFMGYVHYLKDGKVEKEKIEFKLVLTESIAPDVDRVSINLPELEDGSVLEIKYTIKSPFLRSLDTWYFQDELPKMYCELHLKIPEFYVYDYHQLGYLELQMERRLDSFNREITIRDNGLKSNRRLSTSSSGQSSYAQKGELSYELENRKYWVKNVPAMSDYEFVRSKKKFLSRLEFGLNHTTFLNGATLGIGVDWTERNKILLQHAAFGRNLSSYDHLAEWTVQIQARNLDKHEQAAMAHKIISSSVEHVPDANSIFASADAEGSISRGYGNSTDINLNLVLLLRSLDIQAFPLLLSSQQNGEADPYMSSAYDYNYVIAGLRIDSVEYLLDATCPVSCLDLLPFRCLNEYGRTVEPGEGKIVDLMSRRKAKYISSFESEISIDGTSNGKGMLRLKDYAAYDPNQYGLVAINGQEFIRSTFSDLKISGTVRESEANSPNELLKNLEFDFDIENQSLTEGAISFRPVKNALLSESLFQEETRICPIEFDYPVEIQESYTYRIPAGTVIEHIPEPFIVSVPGDGMKFRYQATQIGDKIMVQASFERSQLIFSQLDYDIVRGFYNQMNQKISEKIVLRIVE